jgi:arsenate reductase (thioredoxin)
VLRSGLLQTVTRVLFVCVRNAGRSQMAAAWFNALADPAAARAESAGTQPAERIHPVVVAAMSEAGIDLGGTRPQQLTTAMSSRVQHLITMGCGDACPVIPGVAHEDWPLDDPADLPLDRVRLIRDDIRARVEDLLDRYGLRR